MGGIRVLCVTSHAASLTNVRPEAEWFIGLQRAGIAMTVLAERDSVYAQPMCSAGIELVDNQMRSKFDWAAIKRIRRVLQIGQHQVLHLFNNQAITNGLAAAAGLPVHVVTYRGQTGNISRFDPTAYLSHLNPRVERINCVAEAIRTDLIARGVRPEKLVTTYKGHDLAWYAGVRPEALAPLGMPAGAFVVACVANNRPRKGVPVLIDAARYLPPETPIHILLIGSGMTDDAIKQQIQTGPLADRFRLVGFRDNVLDLLAACNASVLPAIRREGLPKTVIESMALGITPVVTRTGGSPELVVDGECGFVVEPGDPEALTNALRSLADDAALNQAMGERARRRIATHFNVDQGVAALKAMYTSLVAS
jgi:glycosyltransferase involved in cell wall biosynthesis